MVYPDAPLPSTTPSTTSSVAHSKCALIEIAGALGAGKTELVLRLLVENSALRGARIAWVEENATIYPCAFLQARVALERVLFVDCPESKGSKETLWAAHQVIRSQVFGAVILARSASSRISETDLRRLQLAAERNQTTVFLVSERPTREAWPISLQIEVSRSAGGRAESCGDPVAPLVKILRSRGGGAEWVPEALSNGSLAS